ncbi:hypothetical protein JZM39_04845 [Acinetobacter pittii]|uniref:hypothetical protein n=1 Tax=Acinetobacter pittii TaxID=48296 RepID=UPI00197CDA32|nr:hypothetical protein [Acinetobacter pittii]MBN6535102.1 hypothetical protein [Acinetobacter pittii]
MSSNEAIEKDELKARTERYKILFDLYKSEYETLRNEYYKSEDKASKYLTSLTVLSGILLVLFKDVIIDFHLNILTFAQITLLVFLILSLSASWRFIFMVLKPFELKSFPFTQEGISYFNSVKPDVFYYSMTIQYVEVIDSYKTAIEFKNSYLKKAFSEIKVSGILLLILLSVIFIDKVWF